MTDNIGHLADQARNPVITPTPLLLSLLSYLFLKFCLLSHYFHPPLLSKPPCYAQTMKELPAGNHFSVSSNSQATHSLNVLPFQPSSTSLKVPLILLPPDVWVYGLCYSLFKILCHHHHHPQPAHLLQQFISVQALLPQGKCSVTSTLDLI